MSTTHTEYSIEYRYNRWEDPNMWIPWGRASLTLDEHLKEDLRRCRAYPDDSCKYRLVRRTIVTETVVIEEGE